MLKTYLSFSVAGLLFLSTVSQPAAAQQDKQPMKEQIKIKDAATTIRYSDVLKAESNRGHSTARNIAIGVGIGVGAFLAAIAIILTHLD